MILADTQAAGDAKQPQQSVSLSPTERAALTDRHSQEARWNHNCFCMIYVPEALVRTVIEVM
jgi:hypothetical protein